MKNMPQRHRSSIMGLLRKCGLILLNCIFSSQFFSAAGWLFFLITWDRSGIIYSADSSTHRICGRETDRFRSIYKNSCSICDSYYIFIWHFFANAGGLTWDRTPYPPPLPQSAYRHQRPTIPINYEIKSAQIFVFLLQIAGNDIFRAYGANCYS